MPGIYRSLQLIEDQLTQTPKMFAYSFLRRLKSYTPVDTGHLRDSWVVNAIDDELQVYNFAEYASYVEDGTWKMDGFFMLEQTIADFANEVEE